MENDIVDLIGLMEELIEEKYYYDTEYFFCMGNSPKPLKRLKKNQVQQMNFRTRLMNQKLTMNVLKKKNMSLRARQNTGKMNIMCQNNSTKNFKKTLDKYGKL